MAPSSTLHRLTDTPISRAPHLLFVASAEFGDHNVGIMQLRSWVVVLADRECPGGLSEPVFASSAAEAHAVACARLAAPPERIAVMPAPALDAEDLTVGF